MTPERLAEIEALTEKATPGSYWTDPYAEQWRWRADKSLLGDVSIYAECLHEGVWATHSRVCIWEHEYWGDDRHVEPNATTKDWLDDIEADVQPVEGEYSFIPESDARRIIKRLHAAEALIGYFDLDEQSLEMDARLASLHQVWVLTL